MKLSLFDLHCDTVYEAFKNNCSLDKNELAVSFERAKKYEHYVQVMALWTDHKLSDNDGWKACIDMLDYVRQDPSIRFGKAKIISHFDDFTAKTPCVLLSVEDARILNNDINRLDILYQKGIRILTPCWKGISCIGGSHDTNTGLTEFGKQTINRALELGMLLDISHASKQTAEEIFSACREKGRPVLATHSNAYDICLVSRNLKKEQILQIKESKGLIGLNLYPDFLSVKSQTNLDDVLSHISYFLSFGMEDQLCLGCDMDGATMPPEIQNVSHLSNLADLLLRKGYSKTFIEKLFYKNAFRFMSEWI